MTNAPRIVGVVGFKKSGKTKVVEALVRELVQRGHRVVTLKHVPNPNFEIDSKGKDSWKHAAAGARSVWILSPRETVWIRKEPVAPRDILREIRGADYIILEGFREITTVPRICVPRNPSELPELVNEFTLACVGSVRWKGPRIDFGEWKKLADLVEEKAFPLLPGLNCGKCGHPTCEELGLAVLRGKTRWDGCAVLRGRVTLTINGKTIPMQEFVQELLVNVVDGIVQSLKGTEGEEIERRARAVQDHA